MCDWPRRRFFDRSRALCHGINGMQDRMTNMQESFQDSVNSLELTKDKMQNMVPSDVHVALKHRYEQVFVPL